jgi:hypothetical protein
MNGTSTRDRAVATAAAAVRLGFAAWFAVRPDDPARVLGRPPSAGMRRLARAVLVREVVLGGGTLLALRRGRPVRPWLQAMAVADAVNGTSTAVAGVRGAVAPRRAAALAAFDLSGTVSEAALARIVR